MFDKIELNPLKSSGSAIIVHEGVKTEVNYNEWSQNTKPEVPFSKIFYLNDHDSRLYLATDTYVQLIMASGIRISGKNQKAVKYLQEWIEDTFFEEMIEDGCHSYVIAGNCMFELLFKGKKFIGIDEVDITTMVGAERTKSGKVLKYIQYVNDKENPIDAKYIAHLKFTNRKQELWGRALAQSIVVPKVVNGREQESAIEEMWKIENAMVKIFQSYASPMMMIQFEDVGEDFIEDKQEEFKKLGAGAKIITDKAFTAKIFEVNPASKFDKYIEHWEQNIVEAGSQFASQMFTAGFTARASSEDTSDMIKLKIRRVQRRFGLQINKTIFDVVLKAGGFKPENAKIKVDFPFEKESLLEIKDIIGLFEKQGIKRSELRQFLAKTTDLEIDLEDMDDTLPLTSVTPVDKMGDKPAEPEVPQLEMIDMEKRILETLKDIHGGVKQTKKDMKESLKKEIDKREELLRVKDNEEKAIREKKLKVLDSIEKGIKETKLS